jgi:hypothetical protein
MTNLRQAAQQALEALEFDGFTPEDATHCHYTTRAITAIKEALEQPEQEPVAKLFGTLPVYDTPPAAQRKPLTDGEIEKLYKRSAGYGGDDFHSFTRSIEAAHGIKEGT